MWYFDNPFFPTLQYYLTLTAIVMEIFMQINRLTA